MFWNLLRSRRISKSDRRGHRPAKQTFRPGLEVLESRMLLADRIWTGASLIDLNWSRAANWDSGVPGAGDVAIFNSGPGVTNPNAVVDPAFTGTIAGLVLNPNWNSTLTLARNLTVTGASTWASGTIHGGTAGLTNSGTLTVTSQFDKSLLGLLTNNGTIQHTGGGTGRLFVSNGSHITNAGVYDFQADTVGIEIGSGTTSTFTNTGTVRKSQGGDPETVRSYLHISNFVNNGGNFDVQAGRLALGNARVSGTSGNIVVGTGAVLDLTDGTTTTYSGTFSNGAGEGKVRLRNGTLNVGTTAAIFSLPQGMLEWTGGTLNGGTAGFVIDGSRYLTVTSQFDKSLLGLLTNNGTINHTGGGTGRLFVSNGSRITNAGLYDFQADTVGIEIGSGTTSTFLNTSTGIVRKSQGGDPATVRSYLHVSNFVNNGGTFDVLAGRLALGGGRVSSTSGSIAVSLDAVFDLTDGSLTTYVGTFTGSGVGSGKVRLINGTLAVADTAATFDFPNGMLEWIGGTIDGGTAGFVVASGGYLTVTSQFDKSLLGRLTNNGTIQHTGGGTGRLFVSDETLISNAGVYDFQADSVGIEIGSGTTSTFLNTSTGIVRKSQGGDPATVRSYLHVSNFVNNGGTFDVQAGRLALGGGQVSNTGGDFAVGTGAVLDLTDGTTTTYSGTFGNDTGLGKVRLINGTLAVGSAGAVFNFAGALEWVGGTLDGGPVGLTNSGTLTVTSQFDKSLLGLLTNNGTIAHIGGPGRLFVTDGTTINNTGTYDFQGDGGGIVIGSGLSSTFTNTGTVRKSAGTGSSGTTLSVSFFSNANMVDVQSGTLNLASGGASTGSFNTASGATLNFSGGTHTLNAGATFTGAGLVQVGGGTLVINANMSAQSFGVTAGILQLLPGVTLTVNNYTQTGGLLAVDVASSSDYGRLAVNAQALLGGGLRIRFLNPYTPASGDSFPVLTYGSRGNPVTSFGGYDFPPLTGLHLEPLYNDESGTLTILTVPN